jgi:L-histidine Nalpha-methyltransferase
VLDALARRQPELPAWVLDEADAEGEATGATPAAHDCEASERAVLADCLPELLELPAPRAIVSIGATSVEPTGLLLDALRDRAALDAIVVVRGAAASARGAAARLSSRLGSTPVVGTVADVTVDLAVPRTIPSPTLYLCLGNTLGHLGTIGAIRALRVVRARMGSHDRFVLGLDLRRGPSPVEDRDAAVATRHRRALTLLNRAMGTDFDVERFTCRVAYEEATRRVETHLVATRAMRIACGRYPSVVLRQGDSIRTAIDCRYGRGQLDAMLDGVGLRVETWRSDDAGRFAVVTTALDR